MPRAGLRARSGGRPAPESDVRGGRRAGARRRHAALRARRRQRARLHAPRADTQGADGPQGRGAARASGGRRSASTSPGCWPASRARSLHSRSSTAAGPASSSAERRRPRRRALCTRQHLRPRLEQPVSVPAPPRVVAVLDGTCPGAERRAAALAGFMRDGLRLAGRHARSGSRHRDRGVLHGRVRARAPGGARADRRGPARPRARAPAGHPGRLPHGVRGGRRRRALRLPRRPARDGAGGAARGARRRRSAHRRARRRGGDRRPALPARRVLEPPHGQLPAAPAAVVHHAGRRAGTTPVWTRPASTP